MTGIRRAMSGRRTVASACWAATGCLVLLAMGCSSVAVGELPLRQDFGDCDDFSSNDEIATVDCPEGELRILVSQPDRSPIHFAPFRFDPSEPGLAVEADVRLASGKGAYGVGCAVSDAGEPGRGYLFLMIHGDPNAEGMATITRLDWTEAEGQTLQGVHFKRNAALAQKPHHVGGRCVNSEDGSARLSMSIDGRVVVEARDRNALGPLTAALPVVIAAAPDSDVRFDNLRADAVEP